MGMLSRRTGLVAGIRLTAANKLVGQMHSV